jgi:isocitrate dehydrogenase
LHYLEENVAKLPDVFLTFAMKGNIMSHTNNAFTNAQDKNFKVHYQEYLVHKHEPKDENLYDEASRELDADLIKIWYYQKLRLKRKARSLRYASSH